MKWVCAWCESEIIDEIGNGHSKAITHGICTDCKRKMLNQLEEEPASILDTFDFPILVVNSNVEVQTANTAARKHLSKEFPDIKGKLGGDVFECKNAGLPAGCGKTPKCKGCQLRNLIELTAKTGKSYTRKIATLDHQSGSTVQQLRYLVSTEKINDQILLRIDDVQ